MSDNSLRRKTRSASICAPGFSSMEQMLEAMPPSGARERDKVDREKDSGSGTPDGSTPTRRRRPATRSQSARVSGANKSIRRRAAAQGNQDRTFLLFPLFWNAFEGFICNGDFARWDERPLSHFFRKDRKEMEIGVKDWGINFLGSIQYRVLDFMRLFFRRDKFKLLELF